MSPAENIPPAAETFARLRSALLEHRTDLSAARSAWESLPAGPFNWATDWFDRLAADPQFADRPALIITGPGTERLELTFAELRDRSVQVAGWLAAQGVRQGDRVLLMLGNQVQLWESILACIRLGAVTIPATTLLTSADLRDRVERGRLRHAIVASSVTGAWNTVDGDFTRISVGEPVQGWTDYADSTAYAGGPAPAVVTDGADPMLLYFTSGTTARPKLVLHTQASYPVGHLSTMYWIGLQPGDIHLNISSPGWAKHAWSNVFAPWNAGATILIVNQPRFDANDLLEHVAAERATTFCAPPTVYRMLIQADLGAWRGKLALREMVGAGEPLNPEVIEQVQRALGITIRDGFGQTETTLQVGNPPGGQVHPGSMGLAMPGYEVVLLDAAGAEVTEPGGEGELCLRLSGSLGHPIGLMAGYEGDDAKTADAMRFEAYHTGDVASRDADGYITYVGRADDVFKASDYRISPFELESVLIEHPAVAEAAVVPSPDATRLSVPKAYVVLVAGREPSAELARDILAFARANLAPYKRIRRLEFGELPKTISGKIRRVELRSREEGAHGAGSDPATRASEREYWESDFPDLRD